MNDRWRPWVSTYVSERDPLPALTSNNEDLAYDRFQVLDEKIPNNGIDDPLFYLDQVNQFDFGKFVNSDYPWLVWEPSDQDIIMIVADAYIRQYVPFYFFLSKKYQNYKF